MKFKEKYYAKLSELVTKAQHPAWKNVPTVQSDPLKSQGVKKIHAQCCKPGPCSPKD